MATIADPRGKVGSQIGRSLPRLEGRDKVTGRAEYTHTMRLPGMLHAKLFRSTVAARQDQVGRHPRRAERILACCTSSRSMTSNGSFQIRIMVRHSMISRSWRTAKVRFVGEPVAVVLARDPHVADQAAQLITAEYEELPAVYDEIDALTAHDLRPRSAEAGWYFHRPQTPSGNEGNQCCARLPAASWGL